MQALVTGGGGFLGSAIVQRLLQRGVGVRTLQRGRYPWLEAQGVTCFQADLASKNQDTLLRALEGCQVVFHVAAKAGVWGSFHQYFRANVSGTRRLLEGCRKQGVRHLVYTSSPSVVFDGRDECGIDESAVYPKRYLSHYPKTKALAEQMVLCANESALATVALRPHLIWGPGDRHLVPRLLARARAGQLKLVGDGNNLVDWTYIDNAADAHLQAADRLLAKGVEASCAGRAYFISNGEPIAMKDLLNGILGTAKLGPIEQCVRVKTAYRAGWLMELWGSLLRRRHEPRMTRFVALQLGCAHWFDLSAARRDLGYEPQIGLDEALQRLQASLSEAS